MKSWKLAMALATLILAGGLSVRWSMAQAQPAEKAPTQLAVVDIIKVFELLDEKIAGDNEIKKMNSDFETRRRSMEESLKRQAEALRPNTATFKPGSPEYKQAQDKLLEDSMAYQSFTTVHQAKLAMLTRLKTVELYRKINSSIEKYARTNGIAIVFCIDEIDLDSKQDLNAITAAITMQRKIMYAHQDFNITQKLITAMNTEYKHGATP